MTLEMSDFYPQTTIETTPKQAPFTPHPPNKIDVIIELMDEVKRLKQIREDVVDGERKADDVLKAEMYITQLTLSAYKIVLDGLKEAAKIQLTQNNQTNIEANVKVDVKAMLNEYQNLLAPPRIKEPNISQHNTA